MFCLHRVTRGDTVQPAQRQQEAGASQGIIPALQLAAADRFGVADGSQQPAGEAAVQAEASTGAWRPPRLTRTLTMARLGGITQGPMRINLQAKLRSLRLVAGLSRFLQNPDSLESVFAVAGSLKDSPLATQMQRHLLEHPGMAALVAENWRPAPIDLEALALLPPGSLGHSYANQLERLGITPDSIIDPRPIDGPADYITHRLRETHDIVHVLTGFGIDGPGELGLQAFNLAQNRSPLAVMLIFGGLLRTLQDDEPLEPLLGALARGFQLGLQAELVIAAKLEEGWRRPLEDWRRELKLPLDACS